jgi:elongation factor G
VWTAADELQLPRLIVCSRLDRERSSLARTVESMQAILGRNCVPVQMPIGEERSFQGVIDLVAMKAYMFAGDESGAMKESGVPEVYAADAKSARDGLIEMVAEADDALMEKFFRGRCTLTQDELTQGLRDRSGQGQAVPGVCTSGCAMSVLQPLA